jgi:hypothetical protein
VVTDPYTEAGSVQNQDPRAASSPPSGAATSEFGDNPQNGPMVGNSPPSHSDQDRSGRLSTALNLARRLYRRVRLRDIRSDRALRLFLAGAALLIREARQHPERFDQQCAEAGIKRGKKSLEVRAIRLAANDPGLHAPKWANAAAYIAMPPNGDLPPPTLRAAERYLRKRGGMRKLSNLFAARCRVKTKAVDMEVDDMGLDSEDRKWSSLADLIDFVGLRLANAGAATDLEALLRGIGEAEHFLGICLVRKLPGYLPHIFGPTTDAELIRRVARQIQKELGK